MSLEALLVPGLYTRHLVIGLQNPGIAPVLVNAVVITNGTQLQISFDRAVTIGAGGNGGFTASMSGGAATLTYSSGDGSRFLIYDWSRTIDSEETGTLDYTQPGDGVEDAILFNDVVTFSGEDIIIGAEASFNEPSLVHKETNLNHGDRTLRHNRTTIEHND